MTNNYITFPKIFNMKKLRVNVSDHPGKLGKYDEHPLFTFFNPVRHILKSHKVLNHFA